jgi:hypothetical protein
LLGTVKYMFLYYAFLFQPLYSSLFTLVILAPPWDQCGGVCQVEVSLTLEVSLTFFSEKW